MLSVTRLLLLPDTLTSTSITIVDEQNGVKQFLKEIHFRFHEKYPQFSNSNQANSLKCIDKKITAKAVTYTESPKIKRDARQKAIFFKGKRLIQLGI